MIKTGGSWRKLVDGLGLGQGKELVLTRSVRAIADKVEALQLRKGRGVNVKSLFISTYKVFPVVCSHRVSEWAPVSAPIFKIA